MKKTVTLNCCIGDMVYKICPKCNDNHVGTCKNCAWEGCSLPCTVTNIVYKDGSCKSNLQAVLIKVNDKNFVYVNETWNVHHFGTKIAAEQAIREFKLITEIDDPTTRYGTYVEWVRDRDTKIDFHKDI